MWKQNSLFDVSVVASVAVVVVVAALEDQALEMDRTKKCIAPEFYAMCFICMFM